MRGRFRPLLLLRLPQERQDNQGSMNSLGLASLNNFGGFGLWEWSSIAWHLVWASLRQRIIAFLGYISQEKGQ